MLIGARIRMAFSPLRTHRFSARKARKPATYVASGRCSAISSWLPNEYRARPLVERTLTQRRQPSDVSSSRTARSSRSRSVLRRSARSPSVRVGLDMGTVFSVVAPPGAGPVRPAPHASACEHSGGPAPRHLALSSELQLVGPNSRARGPHELGAPPDQPGAMQPREAVGGVVSELAGKLAVRAWP